jgi:PST family polysaccharide transporter
VYLRRKLDPSDFGAFAIAQFAVAFFAYFGDAGFGAALIQKKDQPTQSDLSSIWCLQLLLSGVVVVLVWFAAPLVVRFWPDLPPSGVWLLRALSVDLMLTAARVVPSVLMERELQYGRLSVLEVLITIPYYGTAMVLATAGFGVMSLVCAVIAQGVFGAVGAFVMRPWRPSLMIDRQAVRALLRFGIPYQLKNIIGFVAGAIMPVYAGRALGQRQLGFLNWAQTTAYFPLRLVEVISRINFPLYSRLQGDRAALAGSIERSVQLCAMATLLFTGVCVGLGPNMVHVVFTEKWMPAMPLLYVYAVGISIGFLMPLVAPAFDALGHPKTTLRFSVASVAAVLLIVPWTTPRWGALGFAIGSCVPMVVGNAIMIVVVKRLVPGMRLWKRVRAGILASAVVAFVGVRWLSGWATRWYSFTFAVLIVVSLFVGIVALVDRKAFNDAVSILRTSTAQRRSRPQP